MNFFSDPDFAEFQLKSGRASKVHNLDGLLVYQYQYTKNLCHLYTYDWSDQLIKLAKDTNAIFTLIESEHELKKGKTTKPIKNIIPRHTLIIDLNLTADDILAKMHPKGRYNIKLATKKGITIKESSDSKEFYEILKTTAKRDGFSTNPPEYYQSLLDSLIPKNKVRLYMAHLKDEPIGGIIVTFIGDTATYYYGASSNQHRNLMAPYLLQWQAISEAKKKGFKFYDFLGIADPSNPKDPLKGVTEFKQKFGGKIVVFALPVTIIHRPLLYLLLKIKRLFSTS